MARLQTKDPIQSDRRFIISYYLADDSLMIHEPTVKNSGINGGRFLERTKVKKPGHPPYSTKLPDYYTHRDLFVGAVLNINNFLFKLYDADEYCYKFMEKKSDMFPYSNLHAAFSKFRACIDAGALDGALKRVDTFSTGLVNFSTFYSNVRHLVGDQLNEQEIITLARGYSLERKKEYDFQSIAAVTQEHLRKSNFEMFARLRDVLLSSDSFNVNDESLAVNDARSICKGFKLPIPDYLLDMLLQ